MISRRLAILAALGVAIYPALPALPASDPDLLAGLDTDHDGPHAVYALVQTALVQDEALKRANGRIEELQAQTAGESQQQGGFLVGRSDCDRASGSVIFS